eukprot:TRINITY_DN1523_c0_g1_i1.p1 TRINITY_DN1523_c0_g1~~TRINITY_DN1523_c0_g1_i1.p1  ORF type:complete len:176 (+),score=10.80 TRINITY_DN1523_c0_g1_i1:45-572(+)
MTASHTLVLLSVLSLCYCQILLNHIQTRGTHNSYHIQPVKAMEGWMYTHPPLNVQAESEASRVFELDIFSGFVIQHVPPFDTLSNCENISTCISLLWSYHSDNPNHGPMFLFIENKVTAGLSDSQWQQFESYINQSWPRNFIFTPDDLKQGASTPRDGVLTNGWPTFSSVKGKVR